jgi:hypothetical protein
MLAESVEQYTVSICAIESACSTARATNDLPPISRRFLFVTPFDPARAKTPPTITYISPFVFYLMLRFTA